MLSIRLHTVMGRSSASLWCSSHGPAHCLWSGSQWREADTPTALLEDLAGAALEVARKAYEGGLDDLTDECGL